jgi:E3 ubiquitin-protein ligase SIAH1
MKPPIYQCSNGHSVCGDCKKRVKDCPTCREPLLNIRNLIAEKLANKVKCPCRNASRGCNEKSCLEVLKKHESVCPYRMYHCLVAEDNGCTWTGPRSDLVLHTEKNHAEHMYRSDICRIKHEEFNFQEQRKFSRIISFRDEIFWFRSEWYPLERMLYEVVHYIGPQENASKYKYEHKLVSPSGDQKLVIENIVKCQSDVRENIHEFENCFLMHYKILKKFAQDGTALEYTVKVLPTQSKIKIITPALSLRGNYTHRTILTERY